MRYLTFTVEEFTSYEICFLVPRLNDSEMRRHYINPHLAGEEKNLLAYTLHKTGKTTKVKDQREYLDDLLPLLEDLEVKYLVVCDAEYFKTLTKAANVEASLGYVLDSVVGDFKVVYCPNFGSVFYNPDKVERQIHQALLALKNHREGCYTDPGLGIIKFGAYPKTVTGIRDWLIRLLDEHTDLTADIEGFSLKHYEAGIGTISFAWNKHEGIAFPVDLLGNPEDAKIIRHMLWEFFTEFARRAQVDGRKMRWHMANYDVCVLIYQLFMKDILDTEGLLNGLETMLASWDCTKLISYLATNSCAGNNLGLKFQAQEFAGNYAIEEIKDITKIPLDDLLQYNLVDTLSTWYVYEKHWPTLVQDEQEEIYNTIFKPGMWDIIQMQLTGLPLNMKRVQEIQPTLQSISDHARAVMQSIPVVEEFIHHQKEVLWEKDYQDRRDKAKNPHKIQRKDFNTFPLKPFNPNSPIQLVEILYDKKFMGLPVLDLTETKQPATGGDTLEKLLGHTTDEDELRFLRALIDFKAIDKILTAFLPHFLAAPQGADGWHYLFGNFNLGGTVSGRLSSSGPNLQNLPANVYMKVSEEFIQNFPDLVPFISKGSLSLGKLIKSCFQAPPGKIFCGLDFDSLEDRISALTTKDPNKLKVYTGFTVYELVIDGESRHIREDTQIVYDGKIFTGAELYEHLTTNRPL